MYIRIKATIGGLEKTFVIISANEDLVFIGSSQNQLMKSMAFSSLPFNVKSPE